MDDEQLGAMGDAIDRLTTRGIALEFLVSLLLRQSFTAMPVGDRQASADVIPQVARAILGKDARLVGPDREAFIDKAILDITHVCNEAAGPDFFAAYETTDLH